MLDIIKIVLSAFVGSLIGKERKKNDKPGGSRTMALVCLGATLITIISLKMNGSYTFDFSRLMAYSIASIGFIGSGIILHHKNRIEGLTTASTLWVLVPLGFMIGLGYFVLATVTTILTYYILERKSYRK